MDLKTSRTGIKVGKQMKLQKPQGKSLSKKWQKLEIISSTENTVEFKAYFIDENNVNQVHYEFSTFKQENGSWFYVDGKFK